MQNDKVLVSIIMPTYNGEKYLSATIQSIQAQTYQNIELIIIDDGSQDNTGTICNSFANSDTRIRYCRQNNAGISVARNTGIKMAKGDYIVFCDHDDLMKPHLIEANLSFAQESDADLIKFGRCVISVEAKDFHFGLTEKKIISPEDIIKAYPYLSSQKVNVYVWDCMFKKAFLVNNAIFFVEELRNGEEDKNLILDCLECKPNLAINPEVYYIHYIRESSTTQKFSENRAKAFFFTLAHEETYIKKHGISMAFWKGEQIHCFRNYADYIISVGMQTISRKTALQYLVRFSKACDFASYTIIDIKNAFKESKKQGMYAIALKINALSLLVFVLKIKKNRKQK